MEIIHAYPVFPPRTMPQLSRPGPLSVKNALRFSVISKLEKNINKKHESKVKDFYEYLRFVLLKVCMYVIYIEIQCKCFFFSYYLLLREGKLKRYRVLP